MAMVNTGVSIAIPSYVAILKAKQGELLALQSTPPDRLIPLLEVTQPDRRPGLTRGWPHGDHVAWVQTVNLTAVDNQEWADATGELFEALRVAGAAAVPVVTSEEPPETFVVIRAILQADQRGLVLRLDCQDALDDTPAALLTAIDATLASCGSTVNETDLVLDVGLVSGAASVMSTAAGAALAVLPYMDQWRNVVVAFSAFPELVSSAVPASSVGAVPRADAAAFNHLASRWTGRALTFSDYGVGVPTYGEAKFSPIPNIRYATSTSWMIHRAATRENPSPQYIQLAKDVRSAPYFSGGGFSAGDDYVEAVATGGDGPGNAGSYLKAAMSRHFAVVLDSLANLGAP